MISWGGCGAWVCGGDVNVLRITPADGHRQAAAEHQAVGFDLVALFVVAAPQAVVALAGGWVQDAVLVADVEPAAIVVAKRARDGVLLATLGCALGEAARTGWIGNTGGNPGLARVRDTNLAELGLEDGEQGRVQWTGHRERLSGLGREQGGGCSRGRGNKKVIVVQGVTSFVPLFPVPGERRYIYEKET